MTEDLPSRSIAAEPPSSEADRATWGPRPADPDGGSIYDRILHAVLERRLPPGAHLPEAALADIFGVGRSRIRTVLRRLEAAEIVTIRPNRGATVAQPTAADAFAVFQARRLIEAGMVRLIIEQKNRRALDELQELIAAERTARREGDMHEVLRISGRFHLVMAEVVGNPLLLEFLKTLVSRTSLILSVFLPNLQRLCDSHDHSTIVEAIEAGDAETAGRLMETHLASMERAIDLSDGGEPAIDFTELFGTAPR